MKLVTFEDPIFMTIQGEGILAGTPSVFVRLWGCPYSCFWCDTKDSWKPGSVFQELDVEEVVGRVRVHRPTHVVITGGDPLMQADELADLICAVKTPYMVQRDPRLEDDHVAWGYEGFQDGAHVTIETQASIYDEAVVSLADMMSLSPKLHDWRDAVVNQYVLDALRREKTVQLKVVVTSEDDTKAAIGAFMGIARLVEHQRLSDRSIHYILQPEYSTGRAGMQMVRSVCERWLLERVPGSYPLVRIIGQLHKLAYFVR